MKKIGTLFIIGIIIFISLKSCLVTGITIDDLIILENIDSGGQLDKVILTPNNEMIYIKNYKEIYEMGIYSIEGIQATHYIFGIYCIGMFPFGLRYYHHAEKVFDARLKLTKKHGESFPEIGDNFTAKIVIFKEKVKIGKHLYKRITITDQLRESINTMIKEINSNNN